MQFTQKILTLYKDLCYSEENYENTDKTEFLWEYTSGVKNNELDPKRENFIKDGVFRGYSVKNTPKEDISYCSVISAGKYMFLQGSLFDPKADNHALFCKAAEELYLESLWQEKRIKNSIVFIRFLEEDGKYVFQLFREIEA